MRQPLRFLGAALVAAAYAAPAAAFTAPIGRATISPSSRLRSSEQADDVAPLLDIEEYSRCLSPTEEKRSIKEESSAFSPIDVQPQWQRTLLKPAKLATKAARKVKRAVAGKKGEVKPGSLILLRCGESEWTKSGRFTGWADPDLIPEGVLEIEHAGR